ncbi:MAG: hypothetical protein DRQ56_04505 [Gammaproteobacteria bacterium]|nr:MAG: hypothetical protein DRQ56_04505 [Gammaproteobacteria bacterium]
MLGMGVVAGACPRVLMGNAIYERPEKGSAIYLIPGYHPGYAMLGGHTLDLHPDFLRGILPGYQGPRTMVTRIKEADQSIKRAVFPLSGHHISIDHKRQQAFFSSIDGETMVLFDVDNLELLALVGPHQTGYVGGGHAVYLPDDKYIVTTERRHYLPYSGNPKQHYGCITVRDAKTLNVLEAYSCGGINPHDIALMADGRHVAVSNYGSTDWPVAGKILPHVVEPSLTIIDLESGKVVRKIIGSNRNNEIRHVAAHNMDRIFAIQTRMVESSESRALLSQGKEVIDVDLASPEGIFYAPAPLLGLSTTSGNPLIKEIFPKNNLLFRQGQTIIYDPVYDEAIVTFASGNIIAVIDGKSQRIIKIIRTDHMGLHHPRGVALHPDGIHYAVSGSWRDIYLFKRGVHELNRDRCLYTTFYDHSHLSIL